MKIFSLKNFYFDAFSRKNWYLKKSIFQKLDKNNLSKNYFNMAPLENTVAKNICKITLKVASIVKKLLVVSKGALYKKNYLVNYNLLYNNSLFQNYMSRYLIMEIALKTLSIVWEN